MINVIMAFSAVFDYIVGAIGEFAVLLFDKISGALIEACTLKSSFTDTYSALLFNSTTGVFRQSTDTDSIFGANPDPTTILIAAALGLVFGLLVWQLFKSLFGNLIAADDPVKIIWKGCFYTFLIATYKFWTNAILSLVFSPLYTKFAELKTDSTELTNGVFNELASLSETSVTNRVWDTLGFTAGTVTGVFLTVSLFKSIILLILMFPIGIKFIQLSLEIIERFLQMFFVVVFGPLCLACGVSPSLSEPCRKWFSVFVNGLIALLLNVLGIKLSMLAFQNFVSAFSHNSFASLGECFVNYIAVYAIFKISCEMDNIQNHLGFDTLRSGGMGVELLGGLHKGWNTVARDGLGIGGNGRNIFGQKGAMAAAAAGGSMAASAAMFLGNKGVVGKAVAAGIAAGTKDGRAALGAAALNNGFMKSSKAQGSQFAKEMGIRSDTGQRGNIAGKDLGKVQQMLNDNGIEGTLTKASFDDKGMLHCQMKDKDGNNFDVAMKHGADFSNSYLPSDKAATSMSFGDDTWGAIVPSNMKNDKEQREAQPGGTSGDTSNSVASSVTSEGAMKETSVSQNDPSEPIAGASATAAYNSSSGQEGYEKLAVDSTGNLISCNNKGEAVSGGDHVLSASGAAIPKSDLVTSGGQVSTFSNVGGSLVYNKADGTTGTVSQADVSSGKMPSDFSSFSKDPSTGLVRTAAAAAIISTGMSPVQMSVPTAGTTMAPTQLASSSGSSFSVASSGYTHNVRMDSRNNVVSAGNQYIEAAPSPSRSGMAMTVPTSDGSCMVQAQRYTDATCSTPSASGGYVKVGGQGMAISNCGAVNSSGQFVVSSSSPAVTSSVQLYNSSGAAVSTMTEAQSGPVYAQSSNGSLQQVNSGSIESRVIPSASGSVSCVASGGGTTDIKPAAASMRSDGTCKTYSQDSSGQYVENVSGSHIMGEDGNYHEVTASNVTPVAAGTATKYMVGKFETDSKGDIELASSVGSEASSFGGVADVKTVHGQTITAFSSSTELQNVQTSGSNCNTIRAANVDGAGFNLRLTDDNSASYWQNADVNQRILTAALSSSGITDKSGNPIASDIKAMEIMPGEGHLSCLNTSDQKYHFLDTSMYDLKPGTVPSGKIPKVNMNGSSYFIADDRDIKMFKKLDSIIARNFNKF